MQKRKADAQGPQFLQYCIPVLDTLKELGGSGRPSEVKSAIITKLNLDESNFEQIQSGESRFSNQVAWARFYLAKAGYIDGSERGVWNLTELGLNAALSQRDINALFKQVRHQEKNERSSGQQSSELIEQEISEKIPPIESVSYRTQLLNILLNLPPAGFERLCQRILRESGFERVDVTGRTGDGGIDGHGTLRVNPFVTFQVSFQCKRYSGSVGSPVIREFRGSMMGRADKGIILTTGYFSSDAVREAIRDGAIPIELVDGETLIDLLEKLELGLKPVKAYEIEHNFFDEFRI